MSQDVILQMSLEWKAFNEGKSLDPYIVDEGGAWALEPENIQIAARHYPIGHVNLVCSSQT